jgi:hypothetical protein
MSTEVGEVRRREIVDEHRKELKDERRRRAKNQPHADNPEAGTAAGGRARLRPMPDLGQHFRRRASCVALAAFLRTRNLAGAERPGEIKEDLVDDVDDSMRAVDQHWPPVHHRVTITADAILRRHLVVRDALRRKLCANTDLLSILIGGRTLFDDV